MSSLPERPELSPEQQDTARLLHELLGKAISARYEDFCRLSMGVFPLHASKPMAAHALRELESTFRGILAVPMDAVVRNELDKQAKKAIRTKLRELGFGNDQVDMAISALQPRTTHKLQIHGILKGLGFPEGSDIENLWNGIVDVCKAAHGRSFHKSMEIDDEFINELQQPFDTVVRAVAIALRGRYATLTRRVRELEHSQVECAYPACRI